MLGGDMCVNGMRSIFNIDNGIGDVASLKRVYVDLLRPE